jgi:uncharacterized protein (TIGR02117 family)
MKKRLLLVSILLLLSILLVTEHFVKPMVVKPIETGKTGGVEIGSNEIYVISHGWHTGFAIPADKIGKYLPTVQKRFNKASFIEFGWGDKGFYQAKKITIGLTIQAIFWPTESVVHAVSVPNEVVDYFQNSQVVKICLSTASMNALMQYISNSFYRNKKGQIKKLQNGIYGDSQFYKGIGDYYLMNTCNKWTAKGLKSAGLNLSPTFKLTAKSIMNYLESNENVLTCASS